MCGELVAWPEACSAAHGDGATAMPRRKAPDKKFRKLTVKRLAKDVVKDYEDAESLGSKLFGEYRYCWQAADFSARLAAEASRLANLHVLVYCEHWETEQQFELPEVRRTKQDSADTHAQDQMFLRNALAILQGRTDNMNPKLLETYRHYKSSTGFEPSQNRPEFQKVLEELAGTMKTEVRNHFQVNFLRIHRDHCANVVRILIPIKKGERAREKRDQRDAVIKYLIRETLETEPTCEVKPVQILLLIWFRTLRRFVRPPPRSSLETPCGPTRSPNASLMRLSAAASCFQAKGV